MLSPAESSFVSNLNSANPRPEHRECSGCVLFLAVLLVLTFLTNPVHAQSSAGSQLATLERMVRLDPENTDLLLQLALEYVMVDNNRKALETYFAVLKVDHDNFHAYNNLGIIYRKMGQYEDSLFCYENARRIDPNSYWVYFNRGIVLELLGRQDQAKESYGRALSLNPDLTQALERLRALLSGDTLIAMPPRGQSPLLITDGDTIISARPPDPPKPTPVVTKGGDIPPAVIPVKPPPPKPSPKPDIKPQKGHRTTREGSAASLFNQAMDSLEKNKPDRAVDLFIRSIIADRELLSEPDNGMIQKGLQHLQDRPNRMPHGLFCRGFLVMISGNLERAIPDFRNYIEQTRAADHDEAFLREARNAIIRHEDAIAAIEFARAQKEAKEETSRLEAIAKSLATSTVPLPVEEVLMLDTDRIIEQATLFSRQGRTREAISVLNQALDQEPGNTSLLMATANLNIDLLLMKDDNQAGRTARDLFERVTRTADPDSKEHGLAASMIQELDRRLR